LAPRTGALDALIHAINEGQPQEIELATHNLKGACMLLGMSGLASAATEIESSTLSMSSSEAAQWTARLRHIGQRSKDEIATLEMMMEEVPLPS